MLLLAAALIAATPAPAIAAPNRPVIPDAPPPATAKCPRTTGYYAYDDGKPLKPRKLTELPRGVAYMAVFRHIGPCEAPLTMVDYRKRR